jgi:hypothetical protein
VEAHLGQADKILLSEVNIKREGPRDTQSPHYDETGAIDEAQAPAIRG